ncbi:hypothetical protein ASE40_07660 [Flavobacterium sp. Root935]|uniref:XAC2610-related protein n=1 Tax=Flavobacterium sp. Root935 TaxID=1736610 RepID=UPI000708E8F7|nr:hypothetical protein [Flavobacterium sp. Root935]KRD61402.1 hypothetical protein ASE40_07660 [Flavobacterium sp. Root935]
MKNLFLLFPLFIFFFSCQYQTEIKRKRAAVKDSIVQKEVKVNTIAVKDLDTIDKKKQSEKIKSNEGTVVLLPNNRYAVIILDSYENKKEKDSMKRWVSVPIKVKVFDRTTKKQLRETTIDNYYVDDHAEDQDDFLYYGDFNFDGKMDVAIQSEILGYRSFYNYNFYLATSKGYKFSKSFSEIMNRPISYLELDAKNKKIIAYRVAELDESFEYKVVNNKAKLTRNFYSPRLSDGPFYSHFDDRWNGKKRISHTEFKFISPDIWENNYKYSVLSFDIKNSKKKIKIFIDDYSNKLYYTQIERKDSLVSFDYSDEFNYNLKNNSLVFKDQKTLYKVYDSKNDIGVEITRNGKTTKLVGDNKAKQGSLSKLITFKKDFKWIDSYESYIINKTIEN